jgi:hemolysin III
MTAPGPALGAAGALAGQLPVDPAGALAELKPRLRGWLHAYAAVISIASGATLIAVSAAVRGGLAGLTTSIYCVTVTLLFGTSALYHRRDWSAQARAVMRRLDHAMIFVFIAGTYTPIAVLALPTGPMIGVLVAVWSGALIGVGLQLLWPASPRWLSAPCYIALGWVAVFVMPDLLHNTGVAAFALIVAGGVVYTLGALVYATKRPDPFPGTFGFHEVFHTCTLVAAICQYVAIWFAVFAS